MSEVLTRQADAFARSNDNVQRQSKIEGAMKYAREALALARLPNISPSTKRSAFSRMGSMARSVGDNAEAQKMFSEMDRIIGPDSRDFAYQSDDGTLGDLLAYGIFSSEQGNFERGDQIYNRIARSIKTRRGEVCQELIPVYYYQAAFLYQQHKLSRAASLYKKVVSLSRKCHYESVFYQQALAALAAIGSTGGR